MKVEQIKTNYIQKKITMQHKHNNGRSIKHLDHGSYADQHVDYRTKMLANILEIKRHALR